MSYRPRVVVVSPFLDKQHGTERCVAEQIERLADDYDIHVYSTRMEDVDTRKVTWHRIPGLRGPHLFNTDMSLFKMFAIKERVRFTFRAEAFNVWNNPEFSNPNANIEAATFGNITSTSVGARVFQLGGKLSF